MRKMFILIGFVIAVTLAGCATHHAASPALAPPAAPGTGTADATVRYQIADVNRAIAFYTTQLGFRLEAAERTGVGDGGTRGLHLVLSGPGSSGSRPMPDGQRQEPGGWNRIVLYVNDFEPLIARLRSTGVAFRNDVEVGPGGRQIQIVDPDGIPIELHEAQTK